MTTETKPRAENAPGISPPSPHPDQTANPEPSDSMTNDSLGTVDLADSAGLDTVPEAAKKEKERNIDTAKA